MSHLIAAYSLAAAATLAYVVALVRGHRRLQGRWSELRRSPLVRDRRWLSLAAFMPLLAAASSFGMPPPPPPYGRVAGLVVDGSRNEQPLPGAEVVLRGVVDDQLVPIAETTSDEQGHFQFDRLEVGQGSLYVAGVNRDGVHYPGQRVGLFPDAIEARVRLVAFEGLHEPSPLVALRHDIDLRVVHQTLEVTETLVVMNPTLRGYVGAAGDDGKSQTLELRPFPGFEIVTFHNEFLGQQFTAVDDRLTTSLPWPPGKREVKFSYRLPIERRSLTLGQVSTLPCRELRLHLENVSPASVSHNLPNAQADRQDRSLTLALAGETLAAGHSLELSIGGLSIPWLHNAKWIALGVLVMTVVIGGTRLQMTKACRMRVECVTKE